MMKTATGSMRHPVFKGIRFDKEPRELGLSRLESQSGCQMQTAKKPLIIQDFLAVLFCSFRCRRHMENAFFSVFNMILCLTICYQCSMVKLSKILETYVILMLLLSYFA